MISISIDIASIADQFNISDEQFNDLADYAAKEITNRFAAEWEILANQTLKSSRLEYISSIKVVDEGFAKGAVVLTGWLPNAIESGKSAYDMKPGLLNGPKAKTGKNGKYNTVPFSVGTPGALEENFSGGILPPPIYDAVKNKPLTQTVPGGGKASKGLTGDEIPSMFRTPKTKQVKLTGGEYTHKSSIFEGVRKVQDPVTKQNRYQSFRRVSEVSDPNSWQHPGIQQQNISDKALQSFDIPSQLSQIFDKWWNANT